MIIQQCDLSMHAHLMPIPPNFRVLTTGITVSDGEASRMHCGVAAHCGNATVAHFCCGMGHRVYRMCPSEELAYATGNHLLYVHYECDGAFGRICRRTVRTLGTNLCTCEKIARWKNALGPGLSRKNISG